MDLLVAVAHLVVAALCLHSLQIPLKQFLDGSVDKQVLFLRICKHALLEHVESKHKSTFYAVEERKRF